MIYESAPWRQDLLRDADVLSRWLTKPPSGKRSVIIEKKVFTGAYIMRRLLQSDKLSSSTETRNVRLDRFPSIKPMQKHDRWDIHLHYDFPAGAQTALTIPRLLDLIIHSFIFQEWNDDVSGETKVVFTSDTKKDVFLWLISLPAFVDIMRFIANDVPQVNARRFDASADRWVEWRGSGTPPF